MRFQTFLFILLTLSAIDTIAAYKFRHRPNSSPGSRQSGSHGSKSRGSSGSEGDHTQHQKSTNPNKDFLNAEGGGATRPAGKSDSKSGTVTESKQGTSSYEPSAPTETHSDQGSNTHYGPVSNPHGGTNQQNTLSPNTLRSNQQNIPSVPSVGFKDHVYPSPIPPVQQPSSIPMGNLYSLHPPENTHGASGPTYYSQQPQTFGQPAMHPFVPGQTVFIMSQDSGRDIGQIAKEALVFSVINAEANRIINPHTHHVENTPASSPASNTGGSVPGGTIPGSTGTSISGPTVVHHHHYHHRDQTTKSNQTATNQTNSPAGPSIVDNSIHKISDNDIFNITEELFAMSLDISKYIRLDLQIRSTSPNATDRAKKPLFNIDPILMNYPSIYITHTLYDKHGPDFRDKVNRTQEIQEHENLLIDTYLNTNVMAKAMKWLSDRGFIDPDDFERKEVLRRIWFTIFGGSTCGFERIFASEKYDEEFIGVRDWLYFVNKESSRHIDYMSYVDQLKLGTTASLLKLNFAMDGIVKQNETIFVGTMPELEMALYTICFYARSNNICQISLGGTKFSVYTHSFIYYGNLVLDFGFPLF